MKYASVLFVLLISISLFSQSKEDIKFPFNFYGDGLIVGGSIAYLPDLIQPTDYFHHQWIGSVKATVPMMSWIRLGAEINYIYTYSEFSDPEFHTVGGLTSEFTRFPHKQWQFYFLINAFYGNFCSCGEVTEEPYRYPGLFYLGWGLGASYFVNSSFMLQFGFDSNQILNDVDDETYGFGKYFIRLNYAFLGSRN